MRAREEPDQPDEASNRPQIVLVEITVLRAPDARTLRERVAGLKQITHWQAIVALPLVLVILGAAAGGLLADRGAGRQRMNVVARENGPSGVAAAYGYPLRCLTVTILASDRAYARADFNHLSPCGGFTGYPTAIFHYVSGAWRPVLNAIGYLCPVDTLPAAVQAELGVCS
jgi:hypothetical protein